MIRTLLKPLSFVPALLLMYMIYSFSAQPGDVSSQLSYKVSYKIVETVDTVLDAQMADWEVETWVYRIHHFVRKLAHMTIYFALAVAVSFPLYVYGIRGIWLMLLAGVICVGFACGDEYHQSFVEGRGPSKRDVLIDSFGIFWGIILVRIVGWTGRKTIFRPRKKKQKRTVQSQQPMPQAPPMNMQMQPGTQSGAPVPPQGFMPDAQTMPQYHAQAETFREFTPEMQMTQRDPQTGSSQHPQYVRQPYATTQQRRTYPQQRTVSQAQMQSMAEHPGYHPYMYAQQNETSDDSH